MFIYLFGFDERKGSSKGNRPIMPEQQLASKVWPEVAIVVLNWNGWRDTIECLESLQRITYPNYYIVLVDNDSNNDSVEQIKAWAMGKIPVKSKYFEYDQNSKPLQCIDFNEQELISSKSLLKNKKVSKLCCKKDFVLIRATQNWGFAGGNNLGIRYSLDYGADYIFLVNNDTVVLPNTLTQLMGQVIKKSTIGIIGPKICFYSNSERIWSAGGKLGFLRGTGYNLGMNTLDGDQYNGLVHSTFITGCCMLIKRELIKDIGMLDSLYFLYIEDVDFCWRAINKGWELAVYLDAVIYHKISSSLNYKTSSQAYFFSRNRKYFSIKHHSFLQRTAFNLFVFFSKVLKFILWAIMGHKDLIKATVQGYKDCQRGLMGNNVTEN